jgi:hypothetical protein
MAGDPEGSRQCHLSSIGTDRSSVHKNHLPYPPIFGAEPAMTMRRTLLMMGAAASLLAGCSTDLDINAPYKETTVVYALFNMREDTHFVKINKAFLGEGDALEFAQVRDSSEYRAEDIEYAKVVRIQNGQEVATFDLQRITVNGREPGTFYGPSQTLYYFAGVQQLLPITNTPVYLDPASTYEVRLKVKGKEISARSVVVNDFSIAQNDQDTSYATPTNRMNFIAVGGNNYANYELNWTSRLNCKLFQVSWRFRYDEVRGTDTVRTSFTQGWGSRTVPNSMDPVQLDLILPGETFYQIVRDRIPVDPSVSSRIFRGIDFLFTVADDEFNTFLSLQSPVSGIVEERPTYSNVNGGIGLVASRYTKSVRGKWLSPNSLDELRNGPFTQALNFCTPIDPLDAPFCD